jgi:uncharacterized protein (TIGR00255 family)
MIKSMTGFGKGEASNKFGKVKVEVRSVNHKFLEISARLPEGLLDFEEKVRQTAAGFVRRGKVNLNVIYEDGLDSADKIVIDEKLAKTYYRLLTALKKKIALEGSIRLDQLIGLPGVITYEPKHAFPVKIWPCVEDALVEAFEHLDRSRLKEGRALYADITKRVELIERAMKVIKERSKTNVKFYKERLKNSIKEVSGGSVKLFDKSRIEQEVALYAKNSDITEEIIRIEAHRKNLNDSLAKDAEVGKKVDFIAQELNREINTIGSKASDFRISQKVIQIKSEIEKLREQAKNIE